MNYKSILNAVAVVVAVTMVMLVGCGGDSNPSGGGGNLTGNGVAWMTGDCNSSCAGYSFNSNGTSNFILYSRNANQCQKTDGYPWSTNGNKVFFDVGGSTSEFGTISGNTLTTIPYGDMYSTFTRTTGIPCAN